MYMDDFTASMDIGFFTDRDCEKILLAAHYAVLLVQKGSASITVDRKKGLLCSPGLFVKDGKTKIEKISLREFRGKCICFTEAFLDRRITPSMIESGEYDYIYDEYGWPPLHVFHQGYKLFSMTAREAERFDGVFCRLEQTVCSRPRPRWELRTKLYLKILLEMLNQKHLAYRAEDMDARIECAVKKLQQDYKQKITLQQLAQELHTNKTSLSAAFKQKTGQTVMQFLIERRLDAACTLLAESDRPIDDIAVCCGFSSASHFARLLKQYRGCTPGSCRKKQGTD